MNGGNDSSQFYASLGYLENPGIAYGSQFKRYTARLKATYKGIWAATALLTGLSPNMALTGSPGRAKTRA